MKKTGINPFAAKGKTAATTSKVSDDTQDARTDEGIVVPAGSVAEVLGWVGDDPVRAQAALDSEASGHKRKTLMAKLNDVVSNGANS